MADADRLRHFRQQASRLGLRGRVVYSPLTMSDVQQAARAVLSDARRPTSIITNSDYTAHAIYKAARELSLLVGPGVSVIGHDDLPTSELLDPPLATIRIDRRQMGQALMARLLAQARRATLSHRSSSSSAPLFSRRKAPATGAYLHRWPSDGQGASSR